jgi:L,D-peptidoglycan transpeptidase YkuD (ErfK/YbiS/YcfS/YnhG family)
MLEGHLAVGLSLVKFANTEWHLSDYSCAGANATGFYGGGVPFSRLIALDERARKPLRAGKRRPFGPILRVAALGGRSRGTLLLGLHQVPCSLGRSGRRARKTEGDGATPRGSFALRYLMVRPGRGLPPTRALAAIEIGPHDGWCDDPASGRYNRPVGPGFAPSHEALRRSDDLYDLVVPLGYNDCPARKGRGSAIFLHIRERTGAPTEGCIAIRRRDFGKLLAGATSATRIVV